MAAKLAVPTTAWMRDYDKLIEILTQVVELMSTLTKVCVCCVRDGWPIFRNESSGISRCVLTTDRLFYSVKKRG